MHARHRGRKRSNKKCARHVPRHGGSAAACGAAPRADNGRRRRARGLASDGSPRRRDDADEGVGVERRVEAAAPVLERVAPSGVATRGASSGVAPVAAVAEAKTAGNASAGVHLLCCPHSAHDPLNGYLRRKKTWAAVRVAATSTRATEGGDAGL